MRKLSLGLTALVAAATPHTASATTVIDVRLKMDDGVFMTADVYIPEVPDGDGDGRYPCVVELTPYRKEMRAAEGASYLPGAGIALIEVDARGTGGSQGEYDIVFSVREQADAAAWIEWAASTATEPQHGLSCEQTVGMYGGSYSGIIQYLVASLPDTGQGDVPARPPHLAAIAPQRAYGDLYRDIVYHGGMVIGSFGTAWTTAATALYTQPPTDVQSEYGSKAWLDHLTKNDPIMLRFLNSPYVDATYTSDDSDPIYTQNLYEDSSALPRIQNMRVPTLHLAGFYDAFTRGQLLTFARAHELEMTLGDRGPNFLIAGPWNHTGTHFIDPDQGFKQHLGDWYRYWLEGREAGFGPADWIANGFDGAGARALYFQSTSGIVNGDAASDGEWRTSPTWPPGDVSPYRLYLTPDGGLLENPVPPARVEWISNPTAGLSETGSRWDNAVPRVPHTQLDQRLETGRGLTFSTGPLAQDLAISGPINVGLWASVQGVLLPEDTIDGGPGNLFPQQVDTDFVVKLSDVAPDGTAMLVTAGYLRASHRAYDPDRSVYVDGDLVAPFHYHTAEEVDVVHGDPQMPPVYRRYHIEVWPIAKTFAAGHELRLDLYSADAPNHLTIPRPTLNGLAGASFITLPVRSGG